MATSDKPVADPKMVYRQEFDDWAVLFDPETGEAFGMNPTAAFIWERLDGKHTKEDILRCLKEECEDVVPEEASDHLESFLSGLREKGFVGFPETSS